jgi:hypothetical protein
MVLLMVWIGGTAISKGRRAKRNRPANQPSAAGSLTTKPVIHIEGVKKKPPPPA